MTDSSVALSHLMDGQFVALLQLPEVYICIPIAFSRWCIPSSPEESQLGRLGFAAFVFLICCYIMREPELIALTPTPHVFATIFSYVIPVINRKTGVGPQIASLGLPFSAWLAWVLTTRTVTCLTVIGAAVITSLVWKCVPSKKGRENERCWLCSWLKQPGCQYAWCTMCPFVQQPEKCALAVAVFGIALKQLGPAVALLAPLDELSEAFGVLQKISSRTEDSSGMQHRTVVLLLVTMHTQVALGYMGIGYLRKAQTRQNDLLAVQPGGSPHAQRISHKTFARRAGWFVVHVALPYFFWRTLVTILSTHTFAAYSASIETDFLRNLFGEGDLSLNTERLRHVKASNFTVSSYTESIRSCASLSHSLVSRKLLSLPKLALFPGLLVAQPGFVATALPLSIALDVTKAAAVSVLTQTARLLRKNAQQLTSQQQRMQEHDLRHEEQIRFGGSTAAGFTSNRWMAVATQAQSDNKMAQLLEHSREMLNWLYWSDGLMVGIEVLLSALLEEGSLGVADLWVYCRVVEDVIDTVLMRSRAEADLATIHNDVEKLAILAALWTRKVDSSAALSISLVPCVAGNRSSLQLSNVTLKRGQTTVALDNLTVSNGQVVAVTGPNGCGKSTTFGLLSAGACSASPVPLSEGVEVAAGVSIRLPGKQVVQLTQQSYCPLFSRPVEWFAQKQMPHEGLQLLEALEHPSIAVHSSVSSMLKAAERVAELANQLQFYELPAVLEARALLQVEENWYHTLSGGQQSKADFIKTVFLRDQCPDLLLVDEGFAALDPKSKALVQTKLKAFCKDSLVMVIYHSDHDANSAQKQSGGCVPGGFFDSNLHFENGSATLRDVC